MDLGLVAQQCVDTQAASQASLLFSDRMFGCDPGKAKRYASQNRRRHTPCVAGPFEKLARGRRLHDVPNDLQSVCVYGIDQVEGPQHVIGHFSRAVEEAFPHREPHHNEQTDDQSGMT